MKKLTIKDFFVSIFPAIFVVFLIFFILMPQIREDRESEPEIKHISWEEAVVALNNKEIKEVFQSHSLNVNLILKNGSVLQTKEPAIDDIFTEIEKCGQKCEDIILSTE